MTHLFYITNIFFLLISTFSATSQNLAIESTGTYYTFIPERKTTGGTSQEFNLEIGMHNGKKLLATSACSKCTPTVYSYQKELSKKLQKEVYFNSFGIYFIAFDNESFISVIPDAILGQKKWSKFIFSNFYCQDKTKAFNFSKDKIETYAVEVSLEAIK